jgi:hypothetical protein
VITRWSIAALYPLVLLGCSKSETSAPAASSSAQAVASAAPSALSSAAIAPSASGAPQKASALAGSWSGTYEAQAYKIEVPKGEGAKEWKDDDGKTHSGDGKISLTVSDTGVVSGEASGALGDQRVVGEVDGEALRVHFAPKQPGEGAFSGFAVLEKSGAALKGRLQASTGDSRTVRDAAIELKSGAAPAGAAPSSSAEAPRPSRSSH